MKNSAIITNTVPTLLHNPHLGKFEKEGLASEFLEFNNGLQVSGVSAHGYYLAHSESLMFYGHAYFHPGWSIGYEILILRPEL